MPGPEWKLEDDYKSVTFKLPIQPPVSVNFNLATVEEILKNLGEFRCAMKPEIPTTFAMGQKISAVPDPAWVTEPDAMMGNTILHIRDPRYGWLHYMIPREEARKLASTLQAQVDAPPPGPQ